MSFRLFVSFVFLIAMVACDKKEDASVRISSQEPSVESERTTESASRRKSLDSESVARASPQPERQICVPDIKGMTPQQVPWELRVYCDTKQPLNPQAYQGYMQRLQAAAAEAQREIAARQQAMQATGDPRLAGIQQQQGDCQYRYPGIFPQDGPMAGMCANSQAEIDAYLRNQGIAQGARDEREMQQNNANAASQCRRMCITANNPALCRAGCPVY